MLTVNQQCSIVIQNITNIQKMVSITVFSMILVVLCIGTAVGAHTKRQSSDVDLLNLNRAVLTLKYFATNKRKSPVSTVTQKLYRAKIVPGGTFLVTKFVPPRYTFGRQKCTGLAKSVPPRYNFGNQKCTGLTF